MECHLTLIPLTTVARKAAVEGQAARRQVAGGGGGGQAIQYQAFTLLHSASALCHPPSPDLHHVPTCHSPPGVCPPLLTYASQSHFIFPQPLSPLPLHMLHSWMALWWEAGGSLTQQEARSTATSSTKPGNSRGISSSQTAVRPSTNSCATPWLHAGPYCSLALC